MGTMKMRTRLLRRVRSSQVAQEGVSLHRLLREVPSRPVAKGASLLRLLKGGWLLAFSGKKWSEEEVGFSCR